MDDRAPGLDVQTLVARVMRPARPRLDQARAAVAGIADEAEAWETLAARGVIPAEWVGASGPQFWCRRCNGVGLDVTPPGPDAARALKGCGQCRRGVRASPSWLGACLALASDPRAVLTAEALAREALARLAPWGLAGAREACIAWRVVETWTPGLEVVDRGPLGQLWDELSAVVAGAGGSADDPWPALTAPLVRAAGESRRRLWSVVLRDAQVSALWRLAGALGCVSRGSPLPGARELTRGRAFAGLADPFEPLLALWGTGFALEAVHDHAVVLVAEAPALPAD